MYNEGVKKEFLLEISEDGKEHLLRRKYIFDKVEPYEMRYDKDIACFLIGELSFMYTSWTLSITSLYSVHTFLRTYAEYYSLKYNVYCPILDMTHEDIRIAVDRREKRKIEKNVFPVGYFLDKIDELKNPSDQFLMYGLFQGIRGVSNCELAYLTSEDCNFCNGKMYLPGIIDNEITPKVRVFKADSRLIHYAERSAETYVYFTYERGRQQKIELVSDRIIKVRADNGVPSSEMIMSGKTRIDKRIRILLKHMGLNEYSGLDIYKVGLAFQIKKICLYCGIPDILDVFETEEYKKVQQQYDLTDNNRNVRRLLKGFL